MPIAKNADKPLKYIKKLLNLHSNVIACSHNPILPEIMANLIEKSGIETRHTKLTKRYDVLQSIKL